MSISAKRFSEFSQAAKEQWCLSDTRDYKEKIQCCYNCPNWSAITDMKPVYEYNSCSLKRDDDDNFVLTKFDTWCPNYAGHMAVHNLLYEEYWAENDAEG